MLNSYDLHVLLVQRTWFVPYHQNSQVRLTLCECVCVCLAADIAHSRRNSAAVKGCTTDGPAQASPVPEVRTLCTALPQIALPVLSGLEGSAMNRPVTQGCVGPCQSQPCTGPALPL